MKHRIIVIRLQPIHSAIISRDLNNVHCSYEDKEVKKSTVSDISISSNTRFKVFMQEMRRRHSSVSTCTTDLQQAVAERCVFMSNI